MTLSVDMLEVFFVSQEGGETNGGKGSDDFPGGMDDSRGSNDIGSGDSNY